MMLITFSNVSHRHKMKYFVVASGKGKRETHHTVERWINHMNYKNKKYWDNNIALVKV